MTQKKPLVLNEEYRHVLDLLEKTGAGVFVTGRAGAGKSTLLQLFRQTTEKKIVVLAPTGVAALNVQGQTIHSFFKFPPRIITPKEAETRVYNSYQKKLIKNLDVLVIDEISMVRADMLDGIDRYLRVNRDRSKPFGGVQIALFGDLFQLPPVVRNDPVERSYFSDYYDSPYFFAAHALRDPDLRFECVELRKVYRQESRHFLRLLETVRNNSADADDLEDLNECCRPLPADTNGYITLCARNATAEQINERELLRLDSRDHFYMADVDGQFDPGLFPTEARLRLREGAQVMFIKNDTNEGEYVNGTIGKVIRLRDDEITVRIEESGKTRDIEVQHEEWKVVRYLINSQGELGTETIGSFTQYPLKLAWAITIHKSQGKTFDRVIIDLGAGAFEHGQLYVALSRCRTLEGLILTRPVRPKDLITDQRIVEFYRRMENF